MAGNGQAASAARHLPGHIAAALAGAGGATDSAGPALGGPQPRR